jgi:hypothetical protein
MQEANLSNLDQDGFSPSEIGNETLTEQQEEPKLRKLKTRYVKRFGGKMVRARKVRVKAGEPVFIKVGDTFRLAGIVNEKNRLPLIYQEDTP